MQKVAIIGIGDMGTALGGVFESAGFFVESWDKDESKMTEKKELSEVVSGADVVFLCIPSWAVREAVSGLISFLKEDAVVVSISKGIEKETKKTMDKVLAEVLPEGQSFAFLGGPMIAEEISASKFSAGVLASESEDVFEKIKPLFEKSDVRLEYSADVFGVTLCGVLKNIYALALGMADGFSASDNKKGYLVAKSVNEMSEVIGELGGEKNTAFSVAGLGDLIATGFSECSHNWSAGCKIAKGDKDVKSEGTNSLTAILELLGEKKSDFPILKILDEIINEQKDPKLILNI